MIERYKWLWVAIFAISAVSMFINASSFIPITIILLVDIYLILLILTIAKICDGTPIHDFFQNLIPMRITGMYLFFIFLACLVFSFANLYQNCQSGFLQPPKETIDTIFFSFVNLTTLGGSELVPHSSMIKLIVIWEGLSTILLFFAAFPLLMSRLSNF